MNWDDLRQMRAQGLKPALPLIVTVHADRVARTLADEGCGVIVHRSGDRLPVELLDGLWVWLFLGNCDRGQAVVRAMSAKQVRPAELLCWCECGKRFDSQPVTCETARAWH
ncbi:MAG TPA: hypothetical protein VHN11_00445 [Xanthobacteraceae bacterium]|jgi:hypothetical protein|nr:hypothetical protein [Xanthobacteraceae bacterium]